MTLDELLKAYDASDRLGAEHRWKSAQMYRTAGDGSGVEHTTVSLDGLAADVFDPVFEALESEFTGAVMTREVLAAAIAKGVAATLIFLAKKAQQG